MKQIVLARHAMATRFEFVLQGEDEVHLRAAGEEALAEIERLEDQLSFFRPASEISHVNARAAREPVPVSPGTFRLLREALEVSRLTDGAFDITIAPLMQCWGFMGGAGRPPEAAALAAAREVVGYQHVHLDPARCTVRFDRPGVLIDLGAIGKGFAIETAAEVLREAGVERALIHGGTSTVQAIGAPHGEPAWQVAVESGPAGHAGPSLAEVPLVDEALSVSAIWGKFFRDEERVRGHVLDPRTGFPAGETVLAALTEASAMRTDALSTALLVGGNAVEARVRTAFPAARWLTARPQPDGLHVTGSGITPHQSLLPQWQIGTASPPGGL
jgi:thiamine biosynthesis lipoprotein